MAQAEFTTDPYGARGDNGLDVRCYGDRYVVGVIGASGTNVDRLQLQCARLGADGMALPADTTSVSVGGNGGAPATVTCSAKAYARSIMVTLNQAKKQVRELRAGCGNAAGEGAGFAIGGPDEGQSLIPGNNYIWYRDWACPATMAVTGLKVRYGQHVNAIGVICTAIKLQPASAPPPSTTPPGPVQPREIKTIGKPTDGSPAPVVKMPSFVGRWVMTSRSGKSFTLILREGLLSEGGPDTIFGTMSAGDPNYTGALTGKVGNGGRNFSFTYRYGGTGKSGSGKLLYKGFDGNAIIGSIKSDGPPPAEEVWGGARR
ncbi:hypothetical protein [Sphingomonas sp.]|uniref:hypothetical protein n=1 Tax=Sphingomonas sp. TaxID=28214 RepID=UPI003D6CD655